MIGEAAVAAAFFGYMPYRLDADTAACTFGGLEGTVFFFDFFIIGILYGKEKNTVGMKISIYPDLPS